MSQDQSHRNRTEPVISDDEIRERAYDIWERHHRPEGFEARFWMMAKRELALERKAKPEAENE